MGYKNIYKFILTAVIALLFTELEKVVGINLPLLRYLIYAVALYFFLKGVAYTYSMKNYNSFALKLLITIIFLSVIYSIIIALPSIFSSAYNYINLKRLLSGNIIVFLFPLILLIKPDLYVWKRILSLSYKLAVLYLLFTIPFIAYFATNPELLAEGFVRNFASGASIILLTITYHSKKVKFVTVITFIISLILMVLLARRNQILYLSLLFICLLFITFSFSTRQIKRSRTSFIIGLLFIVSTSVLVIYFLNLDFSLVTERFSMTASDGINYSRKGVMTEFKADFNKTPLDWWLGRGMNGSYFSSIASLDSNGFLAGQRAEIENGYLYLILKGGLLYLIPFVLLSLIGAYKGFFKSKNLLSKAAASIVFINLFDLIGFGIPGLHLKSLLLWFSLALCYSVLIRNYSDDYIKKYIGLK